MENLFKQKEQVLKRLSDLFGIEILFLFGSHTKNKATIDSDVDIGVYLSNRIPTAKIWELQCAIMDICNRSDIDLVVLNDASPLLLYDLLINHKVIYMNDEMVLYGFLSWARKRYWQYQSHFKKYAIQLEELRLKDMGLIK